MPPKPIKTVHIRRASSSEELYPEDLLVNLTPVFNKTLQRVKDDSAVSAKKVGTNRVLPAPIRLPLKGSSLKTVSPVPEEIKIDTPPPIEQEVVVKRKWCCF